MDYIIFLAAMAALIYGADFIIKESERIALHFNISHFVIGATLVAFGTSLPEIAKSMNPKRNLFAKDSAWVIVPVVIFYIMIQDGVISRFDGILFILMMVSYLMFLFTGSKDDLEGEIDEDLQKEKFNWGKSVLLLGIGFLFTIGGANFVVESGTNIARSLDVSEWIIGLFLISLGTSLPELVVSLVAVKKGNAEMSIGNIIGSNVANFSMVLGGSALIHPLTIDLNATSYDFLILASASIALLFILANKIYNKAGGIFLLTILALFISHSL